MLNSVAKIGFAAMAVTASAFAAASGAQADRRFDDHVVVKGTISPQAEKAARACAVQAEADCAASGSSFVETNHEFKVGLRYQFGARRHAPSYK